MASDDTRPTGGDYPPRNYRDTEPLAIWGFVLAFIVWPLGLLLSYLALRRIRRSGDGGWGLSVAGIALSSLAAVGWVVALIINLEAVGFFDEWSRQREVQANENRVRAVAADVADELETWHRERGGWPAEISSLDLFVAEDGTVREVYVEAYRTTDEVCVEAARVNFTGARADGEFHDDVGCSDLGFDTTLSEAATAERVVALEEQRAQEQEVVDAAVDEVRRRGEQAAALASIGEPRDLGLLGIPEIDLLACAMLAGNKDDLDTPLQREALAIAFAERAEVVGGLGMENAAYDLAQNNDPDDDFDDDQYWQGVLRSEFTCWHGGYVWPEDEPVFPDRWTRPFTPEDAEANRRITEHFDELTAEELEAIYAADREESAQIEEILKSYGDG